MGIINNNMETLERFIAQHEQDLDLKKKLLTDAMETACKKLEVIGFDENEYTFDPECLQLLSIPMDEIKQDGYQVSVLATPVDYEHRSQNKVIVHLVSIKNEIKMAASVIMYTYTVDETMEVIYDERYGYWTSHFAFETDQAEPHFCEECPKEDRCARLMQLRLSEMGPDERAAAFGDLFDDGGLMLEDLDDDWEPDELKDKVLPFKSKK